MYWNWEKVQMGMAYLEEKYTLSHITQQKWYFYLFRSLSKSEREAREGLTWPHDEQQLLNVPQELDNFSQLNFIRDISPKTINFFDIRVFPIEGQISRTFIKPFYISSVLNQALSFIQKTNHVCT